jgi:hypothetical protein
MTEELGGDIIIDGKGGDVNSMLGDLCLEAFFAGDGWKTRVDDDDQNNFGFRLGLNSSVGAWNGIRGQLGASVGGYDLYGRDDGAENSLQTQVFVTAGAYKRANVCYGDLMSWGVVWDYMHDRRFGLAGDDVSLHQIRYILGYALGDCNEVGLQGSFGLNDYLGDYHFHQDWNGILVEPMDQYNLYWRRKWELGAETMVYAGLADDRFNQGEWIVGFNGRVPLNCRTSAFFGVHYIIPSTTPGDIESSYLGAYAEETWNITAGFVWTFGPGCCQQNAPLLPVANNGSFAVAAPQSTADQ